MEYAILNNNDEEEEWSWLYDALNLILRMFNPAPRLSPLKLLLPVDNSLPVR